jgi:hypothetical protein
VPGPTETLFEAGVSGEHPRHGYLDIYRTVDPVAQRQLYHLWHVIRQRRRASKAPKLFGVLDRACVPALLVNVEKRIYRVLCHVGHIARVHLPGSVPFDIRPSTRLLIRVSSSPQSQVRGEPGRGVAHGCGILQSLQNLQRVQQ